MFTLKVEAAQKEMSEAIERSTETILQQVSPIYPDGSSASNVLLVELRTLSIDQGRGYQGCMAEYATLVIISVLHANHDDILQAW
jgi:hypothetical protein